MREAVQVTAGRRLGAAAAGVLKPARIAEIEMGVMMKTYGPVLALAIAVTASSGARAEQAIAVHEIPLLVALDGARAAIEGCQAQNYKIAVTVVDRGGNVRATLRADGANPHLLEGALRKAYTAAMLRITTGQMGSIVEKSPGASGVMAFDHMTALGGGLPIRIGDEVVGGIGVGGVPVGGAGGAGDEACARLGLDLITSRLKP